MPWSCDEGGNGSDVGHARDAQRREAARVLGPEQPPPRSEPLDSRRPAHTSACRSGLASARPEGQGVLCEAASKAGPQRRPRRERPGRQPTRNVDRPRPLVACPYLNRHGRPRTKLRRVDFVPSVAGAGPSRCLPAPCWRPGWLTRVELVLLHPPQRIPQLLSLLSQALEGLLPPPEGQEELEEGERFLEASRGYYELLDVRRYRLPARQLPPPPQVGLTRRLSTSLALRRTSNSSCGRRSTTSGCRPRCRSWQTSRQRPGRRRLAAAPGNSERSGRSSARRWRSASGPFKSSSGRRARRQAQKGPQRRARWRLRQTLRPRRPRRKTTRSRWRRCHDP